MAEITKSGTPSLSTATPPNNCVLAGKIAGEAIGAGDACYIKTSDSKVYKSTGAAANAAAVVDGFAFQAYAAGDPVTLMWHVRFAYGGVTPGTSYYLSGTVAGGLADAASTGGTVVIARGVDTSRIEVKRSW